MESDMPAIYAKVANGIRRGTLILCLIAVVATIVFWGRSYSRAERLHGWSSQNRCFLIASKNGEVTAISFPPAFHPAHWRWGFRSYGIESPLAFPTKNMRRKKIGLGFATVSNLMYSLEQLFSAERFSGMSDVQFAEDAPVPAASQLTFAYSNFVVFRSTGLIVPYWFIVAFFAANVSALYLKRPWRFSLRSLFVLITAVAVVLGVISTMFK
jgi:hypothetical protein